MSSNELEPSRKIKSQNRALAILLALHRQTSWTSNEEVIGRWLDDVALGGSRDDIRMELERLEKLETIKVETVKIEGGKDTVKVFELTQRGFDYAARRISIEQLPRIEPDCPY